MNARLTLLAAACAFALAACGGEPDRADGTATPSPAATGMPADPAPPVETPAPAVETPAPGKPAAVVTDCATEIEGNDALQFDVGSISVPSSCTEFTINLRHVGQMPVAAMGHNVVVSLASDREAIAAAGQAAGVDGDFVPAGDARVIAATELVGGGGTTSVTFPVSALQGAGPYEFFCSFPGHWAIMRGSIQVD